MRPLLILLPFIFSFLYMDEPLCTEVKLYEKASFPIGTALNTDKFKNEERYFTTANRHFNSFTPEKVMKPNYLHPKQGVYNFAETDNLIGYCRQNKIRLHGHTLIWHKALPEWMEKYKGTEEEWDAVLKDHIQTIINHCKHYVRSWDVVNEAFNEDGTLRRNIWLKKIGPTYIEKAFRYANEADPDGLFFYNDYTLEKNGAKLNAVLELLDALKKNGTKIDGVGMQMHVSLESPTLNEINNAAKKIEQRGFLVHYSELDISLSADEPFFVSRKKLMAQQKERYKEIVKGFLQLKPESQFGITLWGVSDNDSWLMEDHIRSRPLLFSTRYKVKPAYCGFLEGLEK